MLYLRVRRVKINNSFSQRNRRRILLTGDVGRAFSDAEAMSGMPFVVYTNVLEAIEAAAKNDFAAIAVVMAGMSAKLKSVLKAFREANRDAKIILLARMFEEPAAMQLIGSGRNCAGLADDYLICPMQANRFYEFIEIGEGLRQAVSTQTTAVDYATEVKIKHLEKMATEDDLTGLKNRRYMWEFARQIIERAGKGNGRVTLLVFDIDNFKHYNDVYGHSAGDKILRQTAVLMQRCCRGHDVVGRIGGDEFAFIFWDDPLARPEGAEVERRSALADHPKEVIFIARRFRRELNRTELNLLGPGGKGVLTISGGLASFPRDGSTIQELFSRADSALLEAKRSGKNRIYLVGKPKNDIANIE
jgi:diguanylate cyclase (GGDEF)-like protein